MNPTERWCENPARALAWVGLSQPLECWIHWSESSPVGSCALIPHPVARWATTTPWWPNVLAATKQLYEWFSQSSVCLSVCPSVRHTFLTMFPSSYHHEIFRSYYQWQKWGPCKKSRSEVKGQGHRGHNPTLPFPDCNSSLNSHMMMKWCI